MNLPAATHRCLNCGVSWGPCVCTREYQLWEAKEDDRLEVEAEWLEYIAGLVDAEPSWVEAGVPTDTEKGLRGCRGFSSERPPELEEWS